MNANKRVESNENKAMTQKLNDALNVAKEAGTRDEFEKELEKKREMDKEAEKEREKREKDRKVWEEGRKRRLVVMGFRTQKENDIEELWRELRGRGLIERNAEVVRKITAPTDNPIYFIICTSEAEVEQVVKEARRAKAPGLIGLPFTVFRDRSYEERLKFRQAFLGATSNRNRPN